MEPQVATTKPDVLNGVLVFGRTRVPVQAFLDHLLAGGTTEKFLADFPAVAREQVADLLEQMKTGAGLPSPNKGQPGKKDCWDILGVLSVLMSSVVIAAAGAWATHDYNIKSLDLEDKRFAHDSTLATQKYLSDKTLSNIKQMEELYPYLSAADDPQKREFGYSMFVALGQEDVALKLMKIRKDSAGTVVAGRLLDSIDKAVAAEASGFLQDRFTAWLYPGSHRAADGALLDASGKSAVPDPTRVGALHDWMMENGLDRVSLASFINDVRLAPSRAQAAAALSVPNSQ